MSERIYVFLGIFCLIVGILEFAYITVANSLGIESYQLDKMNAQIHALHNENLELEDQYLYDTAYTTIKIKAGKKGFRQASFIEIK